MNSIRQLAAIMFTDIVGYTAVMGDNTEKALKLVHISKGIQKPLVEKYNGKWLKEMGDGALIQFSTALDAVNCAIEIQEQARAKFDGKVRIGIHLGDITIEDEDVYGDGVNVASRLEAITDPGGIYISDAILKAIQGQTDIQTKYLGEIPLKNVAYELRTYAVQGVGLPIPASIDKKPSEVSESKKKYQLWAGIGATLVIVILAFYLYPKFFAESKKDVTETVTETEGVILDKSVAVLPFDDMSPDHDQEYFSEGMTEEILNHLYKIEDLRVPSRTTSMKYKDSKLSAKEIAEQIGVTHILEGSVRKAENRLRITVQLIDAIKDKRLWSQAYDRNITPTEVFAIQSDVAQQVATTLQAKIYTEVRLRIESQPTSSLEAYTLLLKARKSYGPERLRLLDEALVLDSNFAVAYADKGAWWLWDAGGWRGSHGSQEVLANALPLLTKALEIDPDNAEAHYGLGALQVWYFWNFEAAEKEYKIALQLNSSNAEIIHDYTDLLDASGRFEEALEWSEKGAEVDPTTRWEMGLRQYFVSQDEAAIITFENATDLPPDPNRYTEEARVYLYLGRYKDAIATINRFLENYPNTRSPRPLGTLSIAYLNTGKLDEAQKLLDEIKQRSNNSSVGSPSFYIAMIYAQMGEIDTAFKWLDKAYGDRELEMYWLKVEPPFEPLHNDPRWQKMLDKVGFPD